MAKPKLALIPAAQGTSLYSVLPSSGVGDFDFTRSGSATRINSQGLIETVSSGVSRLNYPMIDGVVKGCPHHILEPQRTNSIIQSNNFNTTWITSNASVTANQSTSPDGTLNASFLYDTNQSGAHRIFSNIQSVTSGQNQSISIFAKSGTLSKFRIFVKQSNEVSLGMDTVTFDLDKGSCDEDSGSITNVGNGWYRCSVVGSVNNSVSARVWIYLINDDGSQSYTGTGNDYIQIYGCQWEINQSYPTSYIPTTTSAVTRSAETANGSGSAATFNSSEGVLMYQIKPIALEGTHKRITLSDGTSTNRIIMGFDNNNNVIATVYDGANQAILGGNYTGKDELSKYALKYKENDFALWLNGFEVATDTAGATFPSETLNQFRFEDGNGGLDFYGKTKQIQYYDTALTDSDLEKLTSWVSFTDMAESQLYSIE